MKSIEEIRQIAQPTLDRYNAELVDISLSGSKNRPTLRILIDKQRRLPAGRQGITLDECTSINRELSDILNKDDTMKESYILEVSSPGLDRPLRERKDFEKVIGKEINLYTKESIEGRNFFCAILDSVDEEFISLKVKDSQLKIPYENIHKANLRVNF